MKYFLFLTLALFALTLVNCSDPEPGALPVSENQRKKIESAVINRFHAMIKYAEAGELENILMHFEPSGPGSYIDLGTRYTSLQDMMDSYRATWRVQKQDYGVPDTKIYVLSSAYALVTSSSVLNTTNKDGITFQPRPWSVSTLWMLQDGQWFIHSFHQFEGDAKPVEQEEEPAKK